MRRRCGVTDCFRPIAAVHERVFRGARVRAAARAAGLGWAPALMSPDAGLAAAVSCFTSLQWPPKPRGSPPGWRARVANRHGWWIRRMGRVAQRSKGGGDGRRPLPGDMSAAMRPVRLIPRRCRQAPAAATLNRSNRPKAGSKLGARTQAARSPFKGQRAASAFDEIMPPTASYAKPAPQARGETRRLSSRRGCAPCLAVP